MYYLIISVLLFFTGDARSDELWKKYDLPDTINCITSYGDYIWMGTQNGVVKMNRNDGSQTWFTIKDSSLAEKYINHIVSDKEGKIFAGSENITGLWHYIEGGLSIYNGESWKKYKKDIDGFAGIDVKGIAVDENNKVWVALNDSYFEGTGNSTYFIKRQVIQYYENSSWQTKKTVSQSIHADGNWYLYADDVLCFDVDDTGYYLYGHKTGMNGAAITTSENVTSRVYYDKSHYADWIYGVKIEQKENIKIIWINDGFYDMGGQIVYNNSITGWNKLIIPFSGFTHTSVPIIVDKNNAKWFVDKDATEKKYLIKYDDVNYIPFTCENWTPDTKILSLYADDQGFVWVGTESDGLYRFDAKSYVFITGPVCGELWQTGSTHQITWLTNGVDKVKIEYSLDSGTTWSLIADNVDASLKTYNWTLPYTPSKNCKIRVSDASNLSVKDESDSLFTITNPFVKLINPIGAERWGMGAVKTIRWQSMGVDRVKIEYSIDDGLTWLDLITTDASPDSVLWEVPNTESVNCRMRISDYLSPEISDSTDASFIILKSYISSKNPKGGVVWQANSVHAITWICVGVEKMQIEYSTDNGKVWTLIVNNVNANFSMYSWTIPAIQSSLCKVRLSEQGRPSIYYVSENFSITDGTLDVKTELPKEFTVFPNIPNPFNPSTTISFSLSKTELVKIDIYNLSGQKVRELAAGNYSSGKHTAVWDGKNENGEMVSSGVYLARLESGGVSKVIRMAMVK